MSDVAVVLKHSVERCASAVECPKCGGFAPAADDDVWKLHKAQALRQQTCGRSWPCCVGLYVCKKCGTAIIARLEAPEME